MRCQSARESLRYPPRQCAKVVDTSAELNCFVTREFKHVVAKRRDLVMTLGCIQLESLSHVETLKQAGAPVRHMDSLREQLRKWAECEDVPERLYPIGNLIELSV